MDNLAGTPCENCIHNKDGKCLKELKTTLNDKNQMIAGGFCRCFSKTMLARTPYGVAAVIYFDQGDLLSDLIKTLMNLRYQNEQAPITAQDEPLDQIQQYVIIDNTLENNTDLFPTLQALNLCGLRMEREIQPISFEKAIHHGINRYAKFDYTLALKTGSMFDGVWDICYFDESDRFVFIEIDGSQGLYLNQGFRQLGGGERFLQNLSRFDNDQEDLILTYKDLKQRQETLFKESMKIREELWKAGDMKKLVKYMDEIDS